MMRHKASLRKCKKTEILSSIFSDHHAVRLEIEYKKKNVKKKNYMEAKQHVTQQYVTKEIK